METARGVAKLAGSYGADVSAYGHFTAAAGFAAVAAGAGLGAYATKAPTASAGASAGGGSAFAGAGRGGASSDNATPAGNVYNIFYSSLLNTREGEQDALMRAQDAAGRRNVQPRADRVRERMRAP
jgi:hypothetical protein